MVKRSPLLNYDAVLLKDALKFSIRFTGVEIEQYSPLKVTESILNRIIATGDI